MQGEERKEEHEGYLQTTMNEDDEAGLLCGAQTSRSEREGIEMQSIERPSENSDPQAQSPLDTEESTQAEEKENKEDTEVSKIFNS